METKGNHLLGYKKTRTERRCNSCGFATFCLRILYQHKYKCRGQLLGVPLKCGYCKRKYGFPFLLKQHQKTCVKRVKKKKIFFSNTNKQSKSIVNRTISDKKPKSQSSTIVCPVCMKFFTSRTLYIKHEQSCVCQSKEKTKKIAFSARKSLSNTSFNDKHKRKYFIQSSDSDSFTSDNLLSEIIDRKRKSYKSVTRGYMCIHCKNLYPAKIILLKHLELNYRCALAHFEQSSYYKTTRRARKTLQPVVARKSFSSAGSKIHSYKYNKVPLEFERSARKSLSHSFLLSSNKSRSFEKSSNKDLNYCPVCYKQFPDPFNFYQHQKKYNHWGKATKSVSFVCKCPFCRKEFYSVRARNIHIQNHADKSVQIIESFLKSTTCDICSQIFVSETLKIQHKQIEHFKSNKTVVNHISTLEKDNSKSISLPLVIKQQLKQYPLTCPVCGKEFVTTSLRNKHFEESHLDSDFGCKFCPIKCSGSEELDKHMQQLHSDQFKHECSTCKNKFPSASHLMLHVKKFHTSQNAKKAVVNAQSFNRQVPKITNAEKIQNRESQPKQQGYFCDICNLSFQKLHFLRRHEQSKQHCDTLVKNLDAVHESLSNLPPLSPPALPKQIQTPKVLSCSECLEEFTVLKDFVPHRLSHFSQQGRYMQINEVNTYTCEICGDISDSHSKVQLHLFWHLQVESTSKEKKSSEIASNNFIASVKSNSQHVAKKSFGKQSHETHQEVVIGGVTKHLFTCEACHIGFTNRAHYNIHVTRFCKMKSNVLPKLIQKEALEVENLENSLKIDNPLNLEEDKLKQNKKDLQMENREVHVEQCDLCNCIFDISLKETHDEFCSRCKGSKLDLSSRTDVLKISVKTKKSVAACLNCNRIFDTAENFTLHMVTNHCHSENNETASKTSKIEASATNNAEDPTTNNVEVSNSNNAEDPTTNNVEVLNPNNAEDQMTNNIEASITDNVDFSNNNNVEVSNPNNVEIPEDGSVIHCTTCNFIFFSTDVLGEHEKVCQQFSYNNSMLENFTPEFKAVLEENSIIASCLTCDLAFNNAEDVSQHITSHQNIAPSESNLPENLVDESSKTTNDEKMDTEEIITPQNDPIESVTENNIISSCEYPVLSLNGEDITNILPDIQATPVNDNKNISIVSPEVPSDSLQKKDFESVIDNLRKNFSQLLSILVSDPDLMQQLGYGELSVDEVLVNVLQTMEQTPVLKDEHTSDLECLRKNIQILLDFCLEDQVMALIGDGKTSTDDIVIEALKIFGGESSMSIVAME